MTWLIFGLDQRIPFGAGFITIREQLQLGNARVMRLGEGPTLDERLLRHWATIKTEAANDPRSMAQFDISGTDFKALQGRY